MNIAISYQRISKNPKIFKELTTFTVEEFDALVQKIRPEWKEREFQRLDRPNRKRKVGQGHPYFGTFEDMVLMLLLYVKTNCSNLLLALLFGISKVTIIMVSKRMLPLLQDRFIPKTVLRKKRGTINTIDELLANYPELKEVIVDGTRIATRRPKRKQAKNYSGKHKAHGKKVILAVNPKDGLIVGRTKLRPGAVHGKRALEEDPLYQKLKDPNLKKRADSAWTGEDADQGWIVNARAKRNHPLTKEEKRNNKKLSKIRIKIEHANRRFKIFKRIGELTVFRAVEKLDMVLNAAINLANYKQLTRLAAAA